MAKRKKSSSKSIEIYKHKTQKRKNNPQVGAVTSETDNPKVKTKKYKYDPHLDPELQWAGKTERLSFEVPTVPLHIHEKIDSRSIIETVRSRNSIDYEQMSLFHDPTEKRPLEKEIEFYKHEKLWSNRLIAGDSLVVMNSLLQKEGLAGTVQCIYIDPPYGVNFGSNFQPFVNKRDVKDRDEDLTAEPETIKAFRDTWELGIHSYLTYLRDRLLLAKELLTESGSCFVQISDENVHLVRNLMDEIFGVKNFISQISFRKKTMPLGSKTLEQMNDYLIWYANDKDNLKYQHLFRIYNVSGLQDWKWVELENGVRRKMTKEEHINNSILPKGARPYRLKHPSPIGNDENKKYDVKFEGHTYKAPKNGWGIDEKKFNTLIQKKRVQPKGNILNYILFHDDSLYTKITNPWYDTIGPQNKTYAVQTSKKVLERCLLMTTEPGDLILDPTCGSGTTAHVAEKWGRRWITCDTSRVAIALTKQRLMTANFDYYELTDEKQGVSSGFKYKEVPHTTLGSIANNETPKTEKLVDQPKLDKSKLRVSGSFTVEAIPAVKVETLSGEMLNGANSLIKQDWFHTLKEQGIKGLTRGDIKFTRLEMISDTQYIYGEGEIKETGENTIICFGSEYAPLEQRQVEEALKEAKQFQPKHCNLLCFSI